MVTNCGQLLGARALMQLRTGRVKGRMHVKSSKLQVLPFTWRDTTRVKKVPRIIPNIHVGVHWRGNIRDRDLRSINRGIDFSAMMYMSIVGSSVPCERLFSIAGNIASEERNRLDPSRLDRLLFLKRLDVKHWEL
ncbi:hypothetical protein TNCV_1573171 [Trichonephila clavipes]|uniref:HAT C-terminal dimerisation domain-containing protein n=1 Tax=Trichonephila clavipes TaxID=2585209 RepID=A0A8X6SL84_TRICX|nr:hypothetical protein TNCV_1573171 [Trichonephila clavipes]